MQKLSNKQNAKVICRFDRLRTAHSKRQKAICDWICKKGLIRNYKYLEIQF